MKKIALIILLIVSCSCNDESQCKSYYRKMLDYHCNIEVNRNFNIENSSFVISTLKIRGTNIETGKIETFQPDQRFWEQHSKHISIGDTVIKKEGEAIMRIYKKDSVITVSYDNYCNKEEFNRENILTFVLRDSIKK